jgi:EmrB/QacA subfamily drug resistance transporter
VPGCTPAAGPWILTAAILGSTLTFIDGTAVNVILPVLQDELRANVAQAQWIVESYALMLAALMLVGGSLGDRAGRKRIFLTGITIFALASGWCGLAPNVTQLILGRAVQGVGAALLVPGSLALISANFSKAERGRAIGTWSGFTAIGAGIGPVLGGWLAQQYSWRWVFFINIPLAVTVLLITLRHVPESRNEEAAGRMDWLGASLVTVGLGGVVYGLIESNTRGTGHPLVLSSFAAGLLALAAFLITERRRAQPMLPLRFFRSPTFSGANLLTFFLYGALGALLFFLPFNLIQVQGYSPTRAAAALLPFVLIMFLFSRWAGGLVERYGSQRPLVAGPLIAAAGFLLFSLPGTQAGSYWSSFFPGVLVMSIGMTISVAPLTTTVLGAVTARHAGIASGINNVVSRTASLLAIAALGVLMLHAFSGELQERLRTLPVTADVREQLEAQRSALASLKPPASLSAELQGEITQAIHGAFVVGFRRIALLAALLATLSAVTSWLLIAKDVQPEEP